ncbi:MAG: hypothetical protein MHPSP_000552 [Paramarteilia canceri]
MRDSYIDKTSLLLLQNSFQLDDICEINCNVLLVFMNLAYWSSFEFARTLISVLDPVKLSVSMNSCVIQLQNSLLYSDESDIIKINKEKQENCIKFLLNLIGFLQNTLFERYQIDELFYEFNVLFFEVLTLLLPHKSLKLSCLQLLQNCCCGAVTRVQIIKNKDLMECFLQNMENNDFIIKIVTLQIVNYMIAFGESGSQERLSILKNYGVPKYLTRIINFASIKENNVRYPEECSQLIVLAKDIFEFFC